MINKVIINTRPHSFDLGSLVVCETEILKEMHDISVEFFS